MGDVTQSKATPVFFICITTGEWHQTTPLAAPQMPIFPGFYGPSHLLPFPGKLPKYLPQ